VAPAIDPDTRPPHARPVLWLLVFLGALAGTLLRYALVRAYPPAPGTWPTATFATNLMGALALGVLLGGWESRLRVRLLLGTGFLGAFTTYSTLAVDTDLLVSDHCPGIALGYAAATVIGGGLLSLAGILAGARLGPR
jgi:CrcB protein